MKRLQGMPRWGRLWKLCLLASAQVMDKYNALFKHLLRLKRVSMELEATWAALGRRLARPAGGQHIQQLLCQARHNMTHFISNLQIYMQVLLPDCTALTHDHPGVPQLGMYVLHLFSGVASVPCIKKCVWDKTDTPALCSGAWSY